MKPVHPWLGTLRIFRQVESNCCAMWFNVPGRFASDYPCMQHSDSTLMVCELVTVSRSSKGEVVQHALTSSGKVCKSLLEQLCALQVQSFLVTNGCKQGLLSCQ